MTETITDNWHIRLIRTVSEIEDVRLVWESLQAAEPYPVTNADIDRYLSVMQASEEECSPLILLLEQNSQPQAMIIGRQGKIVIPVRLGYKTLMKPRLNGITVVYGGVLGQPDEQISSLLICELMKILRKREIDVIFFNHLKIDSIFYRQILCIAPFLSRNHFPVIEPHWRMTIPESLNKFIASRSKNTRKVLRRTNNSLEKRFHKSLKVSIFTEPKEGSQAIRDVMYIHKNSYHDGLVAAFAKTFEDQMLLITTAKGWLRLYILYIENEPVAFECILKYHEVCYGEATAYIPKWQKWNVGTYIMLKAIEDLCQDNTAKYIDFGFGDAKYKQSYSNEVWDERAATYIFASSPYPIFINFLNTINMAINFFLKEILRKVGGAKKVKRKWRDFLQKNKTEQEL